MPTVEVGLAKLSRPRAGKALPRERLFAALDRLRPGAVVWIAAQPGAGKTTLLASYLEARRIACLWYQVDAGDTDPASFFYHLVLAEQSLARGKGRTPPLPLLTAEYLMDVPGFARRFFRELYQRMGSRSALVLDNLHELPDDSPMHRVLATAFEEMPEGVSAFVASRNAPASAYVPLIARERLAVMEAADMRLTLEETEAIASARADLDASSIRSLHERSGGWAAGVTLLAERVNRGESLDAGGGVEALQEVFSHFAAQVIEDAFRDDLDTLLQLGFAGRITPQLARALTGSDVAEKLLERLHRRNLFTERRRSGAETSYQFHHLMRAFLRRRARAAWTAQRWDQFCAHAAAVLTAHGEPEEAMVLLRQAGDWAGVARIVNDLAPALLVQERRRTLLESIESIPPPVRESMPWLALWQGNALAHVAPAEARAHYKRAHAGFVAANDPFGRVRAATGVILTHSFELANVSEVDSWCDELAAAVEAGAKFPSPAVELRVESALLFGWDFRRAKAARVKARAARIFELLGAQIPANDKVAAAGILLGHLWHIGRVDEGRRLIAMVRPWLASPDLTAGNRALWATQEGWFAQWRGETAEGYRLFDLARQVCADGGFTIPIVEVYTEFGSALCAIEDGDFLKAEAYRARADARWDVFRRVDMAASAMIKSVLASHRDDRDATRQFMREHLQHAQEVGVTWIIYNAMLGNAIAAAEAKRYAECADLLKRAREWITDTAHEDFFYQADLVEAYSSLLQGDEPALREHLVRGLADGAFDRSKFFLRIQPRLFPRLFAAALARGIEVDAVRRSIRELRIAPPADDVPGWPWPLAINTLGRFEVRRDGQPLEFSRKAPKKTLQLLKAIVSHGGRNVPEQSLLDALWSDEEGDAASKSLGATVLRLRNLLGYGEAVVQQAGLLSLDRNRVWVDAWAFEAHPDPALYGGSFLAEEEGAPWPVPMRERLRAKFIHRVGEEGEALEKAGRLEEAIDLYLRGLDADSIVEPFYQGLMRCYHRLDRRAEAASTFRRLKQILSVTLGLTPSAATQKLYQSISQSVGDK